MRCCLLLLLSLLPLSLLLRLLLLSLTLLVWLTWAVVRHCTVPYSMYNIVHQADASL